jgi:hypothetical protein
MANRSNLSPNLGGQPGSSFHPTGQVQGQGGSEDEEDDSAIRELQVAVRQQQSQITALNTGFSTIQDQNSNLNSRLTTAVSDISSIKSTLESITSTLQALTASIQQNPPQRVNTPEIHMPEAPFYTTSSSRLQPPIIGDSVLGTPTPTPIGRAFSESTIRELAKKVNTFPASSKLTGPENYELWIQAFRILLTALGSSEFLKNPAIADTYNSDEQAILLMLLRDSLVDKLQLSIAWFNSPKEAFIYLRRQYSLSPTLQRDSLYREFHSLNFKGFSGSLDDFNTKFTGLITRLTITGVNIDPTDQVNQYLKGLEAVYPQWAERIRGTLRTIYATGQSTSSLNLPFLMADILEETRNPASTAHHTTKSVNHTDSKGIKDSKKPKKQETSENEDSKGESTSKKKKKKKKDKENRNNMAEEAVFLTDWVVTEEDLSSSLKAVKSSNLGAYNLATGGYSSDSSESVESSSTEEIQAYKQAFKKPNSKPKSRSEEKSKSGRPRKDLLLLYDTGSTVHIVNSRECFSSFTPNTGQLGLVMTGGGPIKPLGIGKAEFEVLSRAPNTYRKLVLLDTLYCPKFDVNIVSGLRHYQSGGVIIKETIYSSDRKAIAVLNPRKTGFFLTLKDQPKPSAHQHYCHSLNISYIPSLTYNQDIIVEIPTISPEKREELSGIPIYDSDDSRIRRPGLRPRKIGGLDPTSHQRFRRPEVRSRSPGASKSGRPYMPKEAPNPLFPPGNIGSPRENSGIQPTLQGLDQREKPRRLRSKSLEGTIRGRSREPIEPARPPEISELEKEERPRVPENSGKIRGSRLTGSYIEDLEDLNPIKDLSSPFEGLNSRPPIPRPRPPGRLLRKTPDTSQELPYGGLPTGEPFTANGLPLEKGVKPTSSKELVEPSLEKMLKLAYLWHRRLGHLSLSLLKKTSKITSGIPNFNSIKESEFTCLDCDRCKAVRRLNTRTIEDPYRVLDSLEADTFSLKPIPYNKCPIGLFIIDRKSRYRWLFLLPSKGEEQILPTIKGFFRNLKNKYGQYPKRFHFDGGNEITASLKTWFQLKGIDFSDSSPYIHEQNGLIERSIRVLLDRLRATIVAAKLPLYLWNFLIPTVLELINNTAQTNRDYTPYQALFDELEPNKSHKPSLQHYKEIGSYCEVLIPTEKRIVSEKLLPRTESGRLLAVLGYNTYLVYIPTRHTILKTSIIKIYEGNISEGAEIRGSPSNTNLEGENTTNNEEVENIPLNSIVPQNSELLEEGIGKRVEPSSSNTPMEIEDNTIPIDIPIDPINSVIPMDTAELLDFLYTVTKSKVLNKVPQTLKQVLKSQEKDQWLKAIYSEFDQIVEQNTLEFIPQNKLPKDRRLITSRLVLVEKKDQQGKTIKYKARLVARGFQQIKGLDFTETFASTTTPPTWRILLALAAVFDWEIEQIDFIGAFLNGILEEEIYMEVPEGFQSYYNQASKKIKGYLKHCGYNPKENQIILLKKALYGLKQSPREWQKVVVLLLSSLGFRPLISDSAVYYNEDTSIFVVTYVDDCLLIGPNSTTIRELKEQIAKAYAIEDRGPVAFFLGIQIVRDRKNRCLWIHQSQYIEEALEFFNLQDSKLNSIPLQPGVTGQAELTPRKLLDYSEIKLYQSLIGTVMYLMTQTRPDIGFAVQWLSRQLQKPTVSHLLAAKNLLRYLNSYKSLAILYSGKGLSSKGYIPLGYCDSDFAGDRKTSKSTYGYVFKVANGPVSWKCKRGSTVVLSTVEAEYTALTEATREIQWLRGLYKEINIPITRPISLRGDNTGSISTAHNPTHHQRTKHTLLNFHYVREQVRNKVVDIEYIDTNQMPADGLTKALTAVKFQKFLDLLGLVKPSLPTR